MGNFKSNNRGGFGRRPSGSGFGGSSRGRGGFGGGFGGGRDSGRRNTEMHDAVCGKCGRQCQVPFRPTGDKPVYCSDCFRQNEGSGNNFGSRNRAPQSGESSEQLKQINAKLDKIILILQDLELDVDDDLDDDEEDVDEDEDEDDSEEDL